MGVGALNQTHFAFSKMDQMASAKHKTNAQRTRTNHLTSVIGVRLETYLARLQQMDAGKVSPNQFGYGH
tara:strand:+ start:364 stop:570 length:207 start_codon:yes stop_codon:yes gene_type:complete